MIQLSADGQALNQIFRKADFGHVLLGSLDIIGYPLMPDRLVLDIVNQITAPGIAIARLAHGTDIHQISPLIS